MVEQHIRNVQVEGSIPSVGSYGNSRIKKYVGGFNGAARETGRPALTSLKPSKKLRS